MFTIVHSHHCDHCKQPIIASGDHIMVIQMGVTTIGRNPHEVRYVETDSKLIHQSCFVDMMTKE